MAAARSGYAPRVEFQLAIIVSVVMITVITVPIILVMRVALRGEAEDGARPDRKEPDSTPTSEKGEQKP